MRVNPSPHHKVTSKILKQPKIHTSDHLHRQPNQQESTQEGERKDLQIAAKRALTMKALHVEWALLCWFKSEICTNITPSCAAKLCTTMYYSFSCCHNANALSCSPALQLRKTTCFLHQHGRHKSGRKNPVPVQSPIHYPERMCTHFSGVSLLLPFSLAAPID